MMENEQAATMTSFRLTGSCSWAPGSRTRRGPAVAAVVLAVVFAVTGCASVQVQRGKDLASAGVQYSKATIALVDVATDAMIDADSEAHVRTKLPAAALTRPDFAPEKLRGRLELSNKGLVENTALFL